MTGTRVGPDDPRYLDLARRGFNKRFTGQPDYVHLVHSTADVVQAVEQAVREGRRLAVRSGGHCLEGFVDDPAVRAVIDTSLMDAVSFDPAREAFAAEAGATVGQLHRKLFLASGVVVPAGESPALGLGGHVLGGAFGFLCREHGLAADHLDGVEVVVVDERGDARAVIATRDPSDPNHDLWWAHTGGGGGNFGVVTRYWFRSPGATGGDAASVLPRAPGSVHVFRAAWNWADLDRTSFARLVRNFGDWCARHSRDGSPEARLFSILFLHRVPFGKLELRGLCTAGPGAPALAEAHLQAINQGVGAPCTRGVENHTWLSFALDPYPELFRAGGGEARMKGKDAFLRRPLDDGQLETAYRYLARPGGDVPGGMIGLATYGGRVNTVPPSATASAQRDSIITMSCMAGWGDPREEGAALAWVRELYRDLFAATGGVPVPGDQADGAMINHPDVDLADPAWNRSGTPWSFLYYKHNYPRLQRVKARWDPQDVFHHALSIRPG
jgi:aclacinomycin oxidase